MTEIPQTRRTVLARTFSLAGAAMMPAALQAATLTAPATEGPFYPTPSMRRVDVDNDLVKIVGAVREAGGEVILLKGRILREDGTPLTGLRIEIWQCDMKGKYLHTGDRQSIEFDEGFQGFGHDITGEDDTYSFRTILPVTYPGRTSHIHVKVFDESRELLTSQFYLADHPANARDRIFRRLSDAQARAVSMVFEDGPDGRETRVDVVI
jgi:protocatechuate 3,4-dioxygenase beta subunit